MPMRWSSWRSSRRRSLSSSSGWPTRTIWRSLRVAVSSVERMRICSRASTLICCASSRTTTTVLPSSPAARRCWFSVVMSSPLVMPRRSMPEVVEDGADQLDVREVGVEDERALHVGGQLAQEGAAERGLAGAHVADEGHEALLAGDAVEEAGQDLVMALRAEQEARVGREDEGRVVEAEEGLVHRATSPPSCRRRRRSA